MRARGASATDIVILVVAADDGVVCHKTVEAISTPKASWCTVGCCRKTKLTSQKLIRTV